MAQKDKLVADIKDLKNQFAAKKQELESLAANFDKWERQYNLFQAFLAMLLGSPSVDSSLKNLISLLQELAQSGWAVTKTTDELRGYFVSMVMGDYLKCFHCKACGCKLIVNKRPLYKTFSNYYECPSCHTSFGVEADDILQIRNIQEENETLKPLKVFLSIACDICGAFSMTFFYDSAMKPNSSLMPYNDVIETHRTMEWWHVQLSQLWQLATVTRPGLNFQMECDLKVYTR